MNIEINKSTIGKITWGTLIYPCYEWCMQRRSLANLQQGYFHVNWSKKGVGWLARGHRWTMRPNLFPIRSVWTFARSYAVNYAQASWWQKNGRHQIINIHWLIISVLIVKLLCEPAAIGDFEILIWLIWSKPCHLPGNQFQLYALQHCPPLPTNNELSVNAGNLLNALDWICLSHSSA